MKAHGTRSLKGLAALALAFTLATGQALASGVEAYFGPPRRGPDLAERFVAFVEAADETLDCAFYEIRHPGVTDALLAAHTRGVRVRLVVDDTNYHLFTDDGMRIEGMLNPFVQRLLAGGVAVRQDDDRSALMHNKFAIRDGAAVWTGSFNPTDTGAAVNANNAVVISSPEVAQVFAEEFDEMFVDGLFGATSPSRGVATHPVGRAQVEAWFAPEDDPGERVRELLAGAREEVYFMQFAFTSGATSETLIDLKERRPGIKIRGIFDRLLHRATGPYNEFARLTDAGIPVIVHAGVEGKMHHKVFILDPEGEAPAVILGSANASANGNEANDENLVILHDPGIARKFKAEFTRRFGQLARTRAELFLKGLPMTERTLAEVDLVLLSSGHRIEGLRLELPPRWPDSPNLQVQAWRNGKDITGKVGLRSEAGGRTWILDRPEVAGFGRDAYLKIKLRHLRLPELAGGYSFYLQAQGSDGRWRPLGRQPAFEVLSHRDPETLALLFDRLARQHRRVLDLERLPPTERQHALESFTRSFTQVQSYLVESVQDGQLEIAAAFLDWIEARPEGDRKALAKLTRKNRVLRQALREASKDGIEGAADLAARLHAVLS